MDFGRDNGSKFSNDDNLQKATLPNIVSPRLNLAVSTGLLNDAHGSKGSIMANELIKSKRYVQPAEDALNSLAYKMSGRRMQVSGRNIEG